MRHERCTRTTVLASGLILALFALTACGLGETGTVTPEVPEPSAAPPAPVSNQLSAEAQQQVRQFVGRSLAAFRAMPGYEGTLKYSQTQDTKASSGTYQISGKGNSVKVVIQEGNGKGTKLLYTGGSSIKARPGGLLSPIVVTLDVNDPKVVSVRGYRINQILVPETLGQLMDPGNAVLGAEHAGSSYHLLVSGPKLLKGCRTLEAWLDDRTLMPTKIQYADTRSVVFWMKYEGLRTSSHVSLDI